MDYEKGRIALMFAKHPTLEPVEYDIDPRVYHGAGLARGDPAKVMSQSELKEFARNPHRWVAGYREEDTDAKDDGHLCDVVALTPERFERLYAVAPETYPCEPTKKDVRSEKPWNWNAAYCDAWREARIAEGLEVVKGGPAADAWKARETLLSNQHIADFHAVSRFQVQVNCQWEDAESGLIIPVKCLIDIVPNLESEFGDTLADFKRTGNAEYRKWARTVHQYGLHFQAAFYLDAINAATGSKYRCFEHHIQESFSPWESTHRMLSDELIQLGRTDYRREFSHYCRALKASHFRGYDCAIVEMEPWMI